MTIKYGAEVIDKQGKKLGTVDHLMRNTLTGEVSKFIVSRKPPKKDLFLTPDDVLEGTEAEVKLNTTLEEVVNR
jgi:sporulation protein YlmC with PRC-barrel domain